MALLDRIQTDMVAAMKARDEGRLGAIRMIKAGKSIRFVGAGGENTFDQYNNSVSGYIWVTYDAQGNEVKAGQMTPQQTETISNAGGI